MKRLFSLLAMPFFFASCASMIGGSTSELVYVAEATGGAWGASTKAREAMESIDGIAELHMSGARAVFLPAKGETIDEATVAAAFEERGMKLEFYGQVLRPRAKAHYTADAGVTWAVTAGKVRAALIEMEPVIDVYFEDEVIILVDSRHSLDEEKLWEILEANGVDFKEIKQADWSRSVPPYGRGARGPSRPLPSVSTWMRQPSNSRLL